ncbi:LPS-assembly protein LptD [Breoghania sp. L-A4]|uniref:LPS-assembly protein LptD n=1 Tax=Breoghania sp. L-A4 TaxID=2304600 RepID=UPI000E35E83B|nr:LPS-assembly protein LptD [Breoghania sp. L-A4]AXS40604.1 LPS-assembly protein LptD [Breoghania sp. L-A4]
MSAVFVLRPKRLDSPRKRTAFARALRGSISFLALFAAAGACGIAALNGLSADARAQDSIESALTRGAHPDEQMLLEAAELQYDYDNDIVSAVGNVQIYYSDYTLEAERVTLDRARSRLFAEGNVRLTEPDGNVIRTDSMELSDDFRSGFARSLRVDTVQRTRFTAASATREEGETTVFEDGTYTVYTRPRTPPDKPPLWRIKAAKIIHKQSEKTVYYEDARLEFWGVPVAYLPFMSHPDPTVKQKSGFLSPTTVYDNRLGVGISVPYHWVLAPNYDVTFTPTPLSRQGALLQANFRHRLESGSYSLYGAGIRQESPEEFAGTSGDRDLRGFINTKGQFAINDRWDWGWDLSHFTDRAFVKDYDIQGADGDEVISKIYLTGMGDRNHFDAKAYSFRVLQDDDPTNITNAPVGPFSRVDQDLQAKQPVVHPVIDYSYVFDNPVIGGELSLDTNFTSLTRERTDAFSPDGVVDHFRGVEGTFTRASLQAEWRRTIIDPIGQVFTPFAYAKTDLYFLASADPNVTTLTDDAVVVRGMPAIGLEYRYPILAAFEGGSQVFEPIAQVIVRPNEQRIGELPNDDAQSLVFDDTTLFEYDKFSGYDRNEGGTRANIGLQYKLQMYTGGFVSALVGRSFHLAGENSYKTTDLLSTSSSSGLQTDMSDYVSRVYFDTNTGFRLGARARFDKDDFTVQRAEIQASGITGPMTTSFTYGFLGAQPDLGISDNREELQAASSVRLLTNWRVFGSLRYDLQNSNLVRDAFGVGYDDEGFSMSLAFAEDRSRNNGNTTDQTVFLRVGLRTLGDTQVTTDVKN